MKISSLIDPVYVVRRTAYKFYEITHPSEPWIAQGAVQYCDRHITRDHVGLEWGSGRSTAWFGSRLKSLLSIEYNADWQKQVAAQLHQKHLTHVECRYIALEHPPSQPTVAHYTPTPAYVQAIADFADSSLDFVVVDGHYRQACVLAALNKLKPGGLLLVDNTNRVPIPEWGVPADWPMVHQSRNVMTETTIWQKPSTDGPQPGPTPPE
jgi:hypothetical protein